MPLRLKPLVVPLLALAAGFVSAHSARAADAIGSAITVNNVVTAELDRGKRRLGTGDEVHQNELIEVGVDSLGELQFKDETKLALGAGSRVVLDKFVYDPAKTSGSIVMNLVKGTFRFITGIAAKPTYQIKTPHASISVRGTIFDVFVEDDGAAWLLLIEGSVKVCNDRGRCQVLDEPGKLVRIDDDGNVSKPKRWKSHSGTRKIKFEEAMPFVRRAPVFAPAPDFTDEVVTSGTIPPIILWPRHPRYPPPPRWPDGGDKPGGDGTYPPYPGKHPIPGNYPLPGNDASGGKNPVPVPGMPIPGRTDSGGRYPDPKDGSTGTRVPGKVGDPLTTDVKKQTNRDRVIEAYRRRYLQQQEQKRTNSPAGKIATSKTDTVKSVTDKPRQSPTLAKIKNHKAFSERHSTASQVHKMKPARSGLVKARTFKAKPKIEATRHRTTRTVTPKVRAHKFTSTKSYKSNPFKAKSFTTHRTPAKMSAPRMRAPRMSAPRMTAPKSFGSFGGLRRR